jgi:hypothetical protein
MTALKNGASEDNTIKAAFSESGALTKLEAGEKAQLEAASAAFENVAKPMSDFFDARRVRDASRLKEDVDELMQMKAKLELERDIRKLQHELVTGVRARRSE